MVFYSMKMEPGEHSRKVLPWMDRMAKELEGVHRRVDPKDVDVVVLGGGVSSQYDARVRMLESWSDWSKREWMQGVVLTQWPFGGRDIDRWGQSGVTRVFVILES